MEFLTAKTFTPILNTENFQDVFGGKDGLSISLDEKGFIQALETIALPQTKFTVLRNCKNMVLEIQTTDYPYKGSFFVDQRFLIKEDPPIKERIPFLPSSTKILTSLHSLLGSRYFWGGNSHGLLEMLEFYPPKASISKSALDNWMLKGFDCSGLIYYATNGFTPRNTSSWLSFGHPVEIQEKKIDTILSILKPLDAIVWKGHILFIYDVLHTIESRGGMGVILSNLKERLQSIMYQEGRIARNSSEGCDPLEFVIRRWHPDFL